MMVARVHRRLAGQQGSVEVALAEVDLAEGGRTVQNVRAD